MVSSGSPHSCQVRFPTHTYIIDNSRVNDSCWRCLMCGSSLVYYHVLRRKQRTILRTIFQASYNQESVPADWCQAGVVPAYNKGDHSVAANYRPIPLTSICCKIMEHIMQTNIMRHLDVLTESQHSFRKRRSCDTYLLLAVDRQSALENLQVNLQVDAILLVFVEGVRQSVTLS
jgi:hypothetical protein